LPGVARRLVTFLVLPRKVTKRSRPRFAAPSGFPRYFANKRGCATRPSRAHKTCPAAELGQCSPKSPLVCEISRRRTGEGNSIPVLCGHSPRFFWCVDGRFAPTYGLGLVLILILVFCFTFPCAPPSSADQTGVVRRICLSTWTRSGSCEFMRRPVWLSNAGNPAGAVRWGRLLFGYFFFGEARKSD
jgi:hypothetical protein